VHTHVQKCPALVESADPCSSRRPLPFFTRCLIFVANLRTENTVLGRCVNPSITSVYEQVGASGRVSMSVERRVSCLFADLNVYFHIKLLFVLAER
jgi:hypothetical protein